MFSKDDLARLVESASHALEIEDRHLAGRFKANGWKGDEQGVCAYWNERYYQFRIWSELMSSFPWRPELEWESHDLAFFDNDADTSVPEAIAEIKLWASYSGSVELPRIRADISRLRARPMPGVMLVLTAELACEAKHNVNWLADQLGINPDEMVRKSFPISCADKRNLDSQ
jgi:hypothetical protein